MSCTAVDAVSAVTFVFMSVRSGVERPTVSPVLLLRDVSLERFFA